MRRLRSAVYLSLSRFVYTVQQSLGSVTAAAAQLLDTRVLLRIDSAVRPSRKNIELTALIGDAYKYYDVIS